MSAIQELPPLPDADFCSWHIEQYKTLLNPTGCVNAFNYPPDNSDAHKAYWGEKGAHHEPLFTSKQMIEFARAAIAKATGETQ